MLDSRLMEIRLAAACLMGWAATTNYTNHAAVIPLLMAELGFGPVQAGLLSTAFFVTLAIACVPAGMLSDRLGPTGVGTAGLVAVFASNLALGYARHFPDLLLIKVVGGLGCGLAFIAGMRYAALVVPPARVHRALGLYGGFVQLGGGTSLYLIPLLASFVGWRRAFIVSSGLIALSSVAWLALAPRVRPSLALKPGPQARMPRAMTMGTTFRARPKSLRPRWAPAAAAARRGSPGCRSGGRSTRTRRRQRRCRARPAIGAPRRARWPRCS